MTLKTNDDSNLQQVKQFVKKIVSSPKNVDLQFSKKFVNLICSFPITVPNLRIAIFLHPAKAPALQTSTVNSLHLIKIIS